VPDRTIRLGDVVQRQNPDPITLQSPKTLVKATLNTGAAIVDPRFERESGGEVLVISSPAPWWADVQPGSAGRALGVKIHCANR
jgi:hypothetical protein